MTGLSIIPLFIMALVVAGFIGALTYNDLDDFVDMYWARIIQTLLFVALFITTIAGEMCHINSNTIFIVLMATNALYFIVILTISWIYGL